MTASSVTGNPASCSGSGVTSSCASSSVHTDKPSVASAQSKPPPSTDDDDDAEINELPAALLEGFQDAYAHIGENVDDAMMVVVIINFCVIRRV